MVKGLKIKPNDVWCKNNMPCCQTSLNILLTLHVDNIFKRLAHKTTKYDVRKIDKGTVFLQINKYKKIVRFQSYFLPLVYLDISH